MADEVRIDIIVTRRIDTEQPQNWIQHSGTRIGVNGNIDALPNPQLAHIGFLNISLNPNRLRIVHEHQPLPRRHVFADVDKGFVDHPCDWRANITIFEIQFLPGKLRTQLAFLELKLGDFAVQDIKLRTLSLRLC